MLAAIVPHGPQAWFFKLTGPLEAVESQSERFRAFLKSVHFGAEEKGDPEWKLPDGWRQTPGTGLRFATIVIAGPDGPLELSVSALPQPPGDEEKYLLSNINRWRGQLGLAALEDGQLAKESTQLPLEGATATLVDLAGHLEASGMGQPPFAGGPFSGLGASAAVKETNTTLVYTVPEGWTKGKAGDMRKAAFDVVQGKRRVEITVIDLEPAAGSLLDNVNRWREQIGLPSVQKEELAKSAEPIEVGGATGVFVAMSSPGNTPRQEEAIVGAIVTAAERTWFFKLKGDAELAKRETERFKAFVQSVKFLEGAGNGS